MYGIPLRYVAAAKDVISPTPPRASVAELRSNPREISLS